MKVKSESEVTQSYPTLSDPMDCSLPGSSVHGIFQARVLEWVAIAFFEHSLLDGHNSQVFVFTIHWERLCLPMQKTLIQSLDQEDPLEKEMVTPSSTLGSKIPWTKEPGRLQFMGSQRVRHD